MCKNGWLRAVIVKLRHKKGEIDLARVCVLYLLSQKAVLL